MLESIVVTLTSHCEIFYFYILSVILIIIIIIKSTEHFSLLRDDRLQSPKLKLGLTDRLPVLYVANTAKHKDKLLFVKTYIDHVISNKIK